MVQIMKTLTVSVDEETYRRASMKAAAMDTSVSALVRKMLTELAAEEPEFERLRREEKRLREKITSFTASDRLPRDELHGRSKG